MANTIKIKNSGIASAVPTSLEHGELGLNYADGKLFYKNSSNTIVEFGGASMESTTAISDSPPASPSEGDLWFESDTARLFVYYDSSWVEVSSSAGPKGDTGDGIVTGSVQMYAGSTAPAGWLMCDGSAVSRTTYANLFSVIGTAFGSGDGSTTFNLPDTRSRVPVGVGTGSGLTNRTLGVAGGAETKTINSANLPTHTHTINHDHGAVTSGTVSSDHSHSGTTASSDPAHTHNYQAGNQSASGTTRAILSPTGGTTFTTGINSASVAHSHTFTTGGISANHTHPVDVDAFSGSSGNGGFANNPLDVMNPFLPFNFIIRI